MQSPETPSGSRANTAIICLSPYHGGMEMDAIRTARLLQSQTQITVILKQGSPSENHYRTKLEKEGFRVESIPFRTAFSLSIIRRVRHITRKHDIRNVIFFGASELRSLYFAFLGMKLNLIVRHGTTKSTPKQDLFHRILYSRVNWHVGICEHIAKNVRMIIPFGKQTKLKIIYPSLREPVADKPASESTRDSPLQILHVGRVTEGKGQLDAIHACRILYENNIPFRLRLVGAVDPRFREHLENTLNRVPYADAIELTGHIDSPREFYETSDIFLFPSKGEGMSNAIIEALAHGLHCITYDNTSFPELKWLGFRIYLANNGLVDSIADHLLAVSRKTCGSRKKDHDNIDLARKLFNHFRERSEYTNILI